MGYYLPDDIPYHWALAQNFALCDHYFSSALSATDTNRLYLVGGTILPTDPSSAPNGPPVGNIYPSDAATYPPVIGNPLTEAGPFDAEYDQASNAPNLISVQYVIPNYLAALQGVQAENGSPTYRVYDDWNWSWGGDEGTPGAGGGFGDLNVFECYVPFGSTQVGGVYVGGVQLGSIGYPAPVNSATDPNYFAVNDNVTGLQPEIGMARDTRPLFAQHINPMRRAGLIQTSPVLAQVTWILPPWEYCEHPDNLSTQKSADGARYLSQIVDALIASEFWQETVLVVVYDETDTHFDHVTPPFPTPEQEPWVNAMPGGQSSIGAAPIGAGMRVPAIIVSPWTYGAGVIHNRMDHTSLLQLAETVTGVTCDALPPLPAGWRRSTFANLGDVIAGLGTLPVQAATIQADRSSPTGLPASATAEQWQTNAQARNSLLSNGPQPPSPRVWPAVPQACAFTEVQSFNRAQIGTSTSPVTFPNAVSIQVNGFEPQEFIDPNAGVPGPAPYPGMLQENVPVLTGGSCTTRIPSVIAVGRSDITFTCTGISSDPNSLAAMRSSSQQGIPSPLTFTFSITFQNPADTFAGLSPAIFMTWLNLQAWFTVDATVTAESQLYLTLRSLPPWGFTKITEFGNILGSGGGVVIDVQPGDLGSVLRAFSAPLRRELIHIINLIDVDASDAIEQFSALLRDAFERHGTRKTEG